MTYLIINNFSTRTLTTIPTTDTDTSTKRLVGYYGDEDLHKKKKIPNSATKSAITTFPFFTVFVFSLSTISRTMKQYKSIQFLWHFYRFSYYFSFIFARCVIIIITVPYKVLFTLEMDGCLDFITEWMKQKKKTGWSSVIVSNAEMPRLGHANW